MKPATSPRPRSVVRALVVEDQRIALTPAHDLAAAFAPGDLLVVNDAATMPASIHAHTARGARIELRLAASVDGARRWTVALLGAGDWHMRTEDRPPPPPVAPGDRLIADGPDGLVAIVERVYPLSPRLVDVAFELPLLRAASDADVWRALYRSGRPVQYAHVPDALALWDVQNAWAARPWAVEMPSAGRVLTIDMLRALRARGVGVAFVTHAAGLSAVGDPKIDDALPLPERYDIPEETVRAVARARRVVAVGTSVVRALEGAAAANAGELTAGTGITDLRLGPGSELRIVDAILTGVHEAGTSHASLLGAFVDAPTLSSILEHSGREGFLGHEFGDVWLLWGQDVGCDMIRRKGATGGVFTPRSGAMFAA